MFKKIGRLRNNYKIFVVKPYGKRQCEGHVHVCVCVCGCVCVCACVCVGCVWCVVCVCAWERVTAQ